jgi:hypothetical protein
VLALPIRKFHTASKYRRLKKKLSRIRTRRSLIRTNDDSMSDEQPTEELIGKFENVSQSSEVRIEHDFIDLFGCIFNVIIYPEIS